MLLMLLKVAIVIGVLQGAVAYIVWVERKVLAAMQNRSGPNRVGFGILATLPFVGKLFGFTSNVKAFGLGQPLADGIKLFLKEDIEPRGVDKWLFRLAPALAIMTVFAGFAVIPFGPAITVGGSTILPQIADMPVALLYLLAMGTLGAYGVVLAGWASNSKYPLIGALRAAAQLVSYELPLGLAFLSVIMLSGSLSLREIVQAQADSTWFIIIMPIGFVVALIAAVAEANRSPFDMAEAESELVGGFHTEYSGMKFALFFLAEYAHMFLGGAILSCLFFGGWRIPFEDAIVAALPITSIPWPIGVLSMSLKMLAFMFFCIWLRGSLPRFRYDQLMDFSWKVLTPLAVVNLAWATIIGQFLWRSTSG